uniref:Baseplate wedge subunit n=1 Tax=Myoviridae sp. ctCo31 TaxID=2825053 RepID=A0A8S5ULT5_9CAUD|nr:MAG TPA: baseplate wedge subunit [Myoviridae sp. ctCo31]
MQIPKGTKFIGVVKNTDSYDFCTWENATLLKDDESKYYATLKLVQGRIIQNKFVFEKNGRIVIEDKFIDRNYIRVYVDGALWTNWTND